ncbi:type II toxin-antitoxin system RelE/ParE family toxin [Coraliomargarita akajimensis]|uniref:Plasmid maintenance system killer n=1 Tax=Coraliomargarita akajimensis (strain DSM 45221 / IAM 15411 / JCM 23193 / KCTC 12865 / 04OKA010-24) TaxID=583355 RepID=D5EPZ9_CORAD|nr:type II toxin-antitoxin system RelE/ParE family toxin [Coraliomargarita akajimensis]ADE55732.1 plasmid maintenance system killer [Coraliomargarita akajimensis DSM 45221]
MILSFADKETEKLFKQETTKKYRQFARVALRKLIQLNRASTLDDLRVPPGNRLEALTGDLEGYYSIRINQQMCIVFRWTTEGPAMVHITDYH